ncbi:phasin [Asticcacaulis sp. SL142]|uniref:phasin n=1 Tax=Asticcacaulis sp. SL142 TaxID=2995155 RepID=UPI00226D3005|nr:phasin [Asticcacaulis sp. SL142]WAC46885.1 phasin [Asticcacaulis sp. SL142]
MTNHGPFEQGLKLMGAQQQLATRSLLNLVEMITASSHRYASQTTAFAEDAVRLMKEASAVRDPQGLTDLQKEWTQTCVKYSENQARTTMQFVEQCGKQALNTAANAKAIVKGDVTAPPSGEAPPTE